jgi:hypothetical protein
MEDFVMPQRPSAGRLAAFYALLLAASFLFSSAAHPAPASEMTVTLLSWSHGELQGQEENGQVLKIITTPATWILRRGLPTTARDFVPGETLQIRRGRGTGGTLRALLVCDPETAAALAGARGHPLTGTLLKAGGKVWILQPDDGALPLPLCLTAHTMFQAGGALVASGVFTAGTRVTIQTRGLPTGLMSAVSVSDGTETMAVIKKAPRPRKTFSGTIREARPDLGQLTIQNKAGFSQMIGVDSQTSILVRTRKGRHLGTWDDLTVGRPIFARFAAAEAGGGSDPLAATLSVSDP